MGWYSNSKNATGSDSLLHRLRTYLSLNKDNAIFCNMPGMRMRPRQWAGVLFCQIKPGWMMLKERGRWCALLRRRRQRKRLDFSNLLIFFQIILFQCPICNKYPKKGEGLYKHVRSHKMAAPLECTYPGCNAVRGHIILWIQFNMDSFSDGNIRECNATTRLQLPQKKQQDAN